MTRWTEYIWTNGLANLIPQLIPGFDKAMSKYSKKILSNEADDGGHDISVIFLVAVKINANQI